MTEPWPEPPKVSPLLRVPGEVCHPGLGPVAAVVVTYNTGIGLLDRLARLAAQVDAVVIVDNGSGEDTRAALRSAVAMLPGVSLILNDDNRGLAAAQTQGMGAVLAAGFSWLLLMDDDSIPAPDMVAAMAEAEARHSGVFGLLAPRLRYPDSGRVPGFITARGRGWWPRKRPAPHAGMLPDPVFVIASGSLMRASVVRAVGPMRADFFIDYVDVEYCFRLRKAGVRLAVVGEAVLDHSLGCQKAHRVLGRTIWCSNHNPFRCHAMARNRLRLWLGWGGRHPGWALQDMLALVVQVWRVLALEEGGRAKATAIVRGLWDGVRAGRL